MTTDVCPSAFLYQLPDPVQAPLVAIVRELTGMDEEEKRTTGALPYLDPLEVRSESVQVQLDDGRWVAGGSRRSARSRASGRGTCCTRPRPPRPTSGWFEEGRIRRAYTDSPRLGRGIRRPRRDQCLLSLAAGQR